jgi:peroxiredoxin
MNHYLLRIACALLAGLVGAVLTSAAEQDDAPQEVQLTGQLTRDDPRDKLVVVRNAFAKVHRLPLKAGQTYRLVLTSRAFVPQLRLEDSQGKQLASNASTVAGTATALSYRPNVDGDYRAVVSSTSADGTGDYTLRAEVVGWPPELETRISALTLRSAAERGEVLNQLKTYLTEKGHNLTAADVDLALKAAEILGSTYQARALEASTDLARLVSAATDKRAAGGARLLAGLAHRLNMPPGEHLELPTTTVEGRTFDWTTYRGKLVAVTFWASWCQPCQTELANVRRLYDAHHGKGFEVVTVSTDEDRQALTDSLRRHPYPWVCLHDVSPLGQSPGPLAERYGITKLPQTFLLDREGAVISTRALDRDLERLLTLHLATPSRGPTTEPRPPAAANPPAGAPRITPIVPAPLPKSRPPEPPPAEGPTAANLVAVLLTVVVLLTPFVVLLAVQAYRRGLSFFVWLLAGFLAANPLFPLVLLGLLPDRARQARRRAELQDLERRLGGEQPAEQRNLSMDHANARSSAEALPSTASVLPECSLGDVETQAAPPRPPI